LLVSSIAIVTESLLGLVEIADMLGVCRQRAAQIAAAYPDFPDPEVVMGGRRGWSRPKIERWLAEHPSRPPGRPRRRSP